MPDVIMDGYINAWLVPTIPNIAAPVASTVTSGTAIELLLTPDGLKGLQSTTNWVNNSPLGSTFDTQLPGTVSYSDMSLQFKWQTGTDVLWNLLVYGYATNLVIRRRMLRSTALVATHPLEVYPIVCGQFTPADYARNTLTTFTVPIGLSSEPNLRAVAA